MYEQPSRLCRNSESEVWGTFDSKDISRLIKIITGVYTNLWQEQSHAITIKSNINIHIIHSVHLKGPMNSLYLILHINGNPGDFPVLPICTKLLEFSST